MMRNSTRQSRLRKNHDPWHDYNSPISTKAILEVEARMRKEARWHVQECPNDAAGKARRGNLIDEVAL